MDTVRVDDTDPSVIYSPSRWFSKSTTLAYNGTEKWTIENGAKATIYFVGSGIGVYGTVLPESSGSVAPMSLYTTDGGSPVTFTPNRAGSTLYQQLFFQSPVLHEGHHTLTVTSLAVINSDMLCLDFFTINKAAVPASSGVTTAPVQGKSKSELLIGPIIGGALGVLILTCIVLLYLRRGRQEHHPNENIGAPPPIDREGRQIQLSLLISPYNMSQPPQHSSKGQPLVDARTGMVATQVTNSRSSPGTVQHPSQQPPAAATTSSALGNTTHPNNLVYMGAFPSTQSIPGDPTYHPPPSYRE